jgi:hypothetical protein
MPPLLAKIAVGIAPAGAIAAGIAESGNGSASPAGVSANQARAIVSLERDSSQLLAAVPAGEIRPDASLRESWMSTVEGIASSLGATVGELAKDVRGDHSLAQIASEHGRAPGEPAGQILSSVQAQLAVAVAGGELSPSASAATLDAVRWAMAVR